MLPNHPNVKLTVSRIGTFHSWWLPGYPVDGFFDSITSYENAWSPLNLYHRKVNGRYTSGGPWIMVKHTCKDSSESAQVFRYGGDLAYEGRYGYAGASYDYSLTDLTPDQAYDDASRFGAEAWAAMRPAQPNFKAAQELYELKDIHSVIKQAVHFCSEQVAREQARRVANGGSQRYWYSHAGEWYLSIQFGWLPILGTCLNFAKAFRARKKNFDQLLRDEGKWVKRSRRLSHHNQDESTVDWETSVPWQKANPYMIPTHVTQCYDDGWTVRNIRSYKSRVWCVGKFKYFLPSGPRDRNWRWKMYFRMLGGRITPSQVYAVIPWSWFVNYFADLGHFMDAVSDGVEDRLICEYAYVMHNRIFQLTSTNTQQVWDGSTTNPVSQTVSNKRVWTSEFKTRVNATVVGFGFNNENLTLFQKSIIGALGLSKI